MIDDQEGRQAVAQVEKARQQGRRGKRPAPILEAKGVRKHFGGIKAVDGMDLSVMKGEMVGLIGPNGAGKTTFFNVLAGWYPPDGGTVRFQGKPIHSLWSHRVARRGLVRTFQITRTLSRMSVLENMMLVPQHQLGEHVWAPFLPVLGRPRLATQEQEVAKKAHRLLEFFQLDHLAQEYAGALSGGQRKLLELARVLMLDPRMILLDEPTAGVNPTLARRIMTRLQEIREKQGITILLIEHDMETVMANCKRIVVMAAGRQLAQGTPEEIQSNKQVIDAYLGG